MSFPPKAETVRRFREATGMGWMEAKLFFARRGAELCERILRAHQEQGKKPLHDPTEDDPELRERIAVARQAAEQTHRQWIAEHNRELRESGRERKIGAWPLGSCHHIWKILKENLKGHGISWYSPAEMNPGYRFD